MSIQLTLFAEGLDEYEEAGEAGEEHGADGDGPEVLGRAKHGDGRHAQGDRERPAARVDAGQVGLQQVVAVVGGDEQEDDGDAEELQVGDEEDCVPGRGREVGEFEVRYCFLYPQKLYVHTQM